MDYAGLLARWSEAVGVENVHVRPYDTNQFLGGTLVSDFAHRIGLKSSDSLVPVDSASRNEARLGPAHVAAMRLFNELPFPTSGSYLSFVEGVTGALSTQDRPKTMLLTPEQRRAILAEHEASNAEVARVYLGRESGELVSDSSVPSTEPEETGPEVLALADLQAMFREYRRAVRAGESSDIRLHLDDRGVLQFVEVFGKRFAPRIGPLRALAARDFLAVIAQLASDGRPIPAATLDRYAQQIVAGERTKRSAAVDVLREHGGGIARSSLPWSEKLALGLYALYARFGGPS